MLEPLEPPLIETGYLDPECLPIDHPDRAEDVLRALATSVGYPLDPRRLYRAALRLSEALEMSARGES